MRDDKDLLRSAHLKKLGMEMARIHDQIPDTWADDKAKCSSKDAQLAFSFFEKAWEILNAYAYPRGKVEYVQESFDYSPISYLQLFYKKPDDKFRVWLYWETKKKTGIDQVEHFFVLYRTGKTYCKKRFLKRKGKVEKLMDSSDFYTPLRELKKGRRVPLSKKTLYQAMDKTFPMVLEALFEEAAGSTEDWLWGKRFVFSSFWEEEWEEEEEEF